LDGAKPVIASAKACAQEEFAVMSNCPNVNFAQPTTHKSTQMLSGMILSQETLHEQL